MAKERDIRYYFCRFRSASSREPEIEKICVNPAISKTRMTCGERDERATDPPVFRIVRVMVSSTLSPALAIYSVFEKSKRTRCWRCSAIFFNSPSIAIALSASKRREREIMTIPLIQLLNDLPVLGNGKDMLCLQFFRFLSGFSRMTMLLLPPAYSVPDRTHIVFILDGSAFRSDLY